MPRLSGSGSGSASPCRVNYPFAAVAGQRAEKHALLLLAVDPRLRGVLIATAGDSGGSALARSFGSLLPRNRNRERLPVSLSIDVEADMVQLPIGVTDDCLLGGLDLEQTLATGERQVAAGLLARANGRVLYVDDLNLLNANTSTHVAHALDTRQVSVEREGVSAIHDADFVLLATFNPAEGEPSALLRDRAAMIVDSDADTSADERAEMIDRVFRFDRDPFGFADEFEYETDQIRSSIATARARLLHIEVSKVHRRQLVQAAIRLGVEGNRADVFALKAARANAALDGRDAVNEDDLVIGIQLVLVPRATMLPSTDEEVRKKVEPSQPEAERLDESMPADLPAPEPRDSAPLSSSVEDLLLHALDSRVPDDAFSLSERATRSARTGKRFKASKSDRGRYVRSVQKPTRERRIAIDATLRAAAPFQLRRLALDNKQTAASGARKGSPKAHVRRVNIQPDDFRFKEFKHRSGILFIFAVDSSGSMAFNRMAQAKGALNRLLQQAYLHRDQVALVSFRGARAEVLLTPTRSVELAKRSLDALPAGGGTPLAAAVVKAVELARCARLRGMSQAMLVMFTDGRANVALQEESATPGTIEVELRQVGSLLRSEGITSVVVDTKSKFVSSGEAEALARMLGARYVYLPRSDSATVYKAIASAAETPRP